MYLYTGDELLPLPVLEFNSTMGASYSFDGLIPIYPCDGIPAFKEF
jgi:hypothetical protein